MNDELGTGDGQRAGTDGGGRPAGRHHQAGQVFTGGAAPGLASMARAGVPMGDDLGHGGELPGTDGRRVSAGPPVASGDEDAPAGGPPGPGPAGRSQGARRRKSKNRSWWVELPILLAFALVLALLIKTFIVQAFFIPSSSMETTLDIGDKVLVNKMVYDFRPIHRGDIVVFNGEGSWDPVTSQTAPPLVRLWNAISGLFGTAPGVHDYIKRVIGIPGDHVACCDARGRITVNGVPLNEKPYLYAGNAPSTVRFSVTVPPGRLWVMGDHRNVSYDSRGHRQDPGDGTVPVDRVVGRAFVIVAPVSRWRILPIPATFDQRRLAGASAAALAAGPAPAGLALPAGLAAPALSGPLAPAVPLGLGLAGAFPLTWLQLRLRRRLSHSLRRGRPRRRPVARRRARRGPGRPGHG
jgi:signal peptidase I